MFTPDQIRPLLEALSHSDAVIVGGQAINLWSETYQKDEEPWRSLRPFTSRDLDALGSAAALLDCARHVHGQALFPHAGEKTVNTGKLTVVIGGQEVEADFLSEVKGLNNQEIRQTAKLIAWHDLRLRLLHPILCVEQLAWLHFTTVCTQQSTFVNLQIPDTAGTQPVGTLARNVAPQSSRVVVVGNEPLLEAYISTNGQPALVLYASPNTTNVLETTPNPADRLSWSTARTVTMTNVFQLIEPVCTNRCTRFFRARRE